jgi:hypothetical protein
MTYISKLLDWLLAYENRALDQIELLAVLFAILYFTWHVIRAGL